MSRVILLVYVVMVVGCQAQPSGPTETSLADFPELAQSLNSGASASPLTLYEGLPHQFFDPELFEAELASQETIDVGGYPFYATPLEMSDETARSLIALLTTRTSIRPIDLTAAKACGGFHPDYAVTWQVDGTTYHALFCFGCCEIRMAGGGLELNVEFAGDALNRFERLLNAYRNLRPVSTN